MLELLKFMWPIPDKSIAHRLAMPFNTVVTNVPGPQFPLYMLGAKLLESFPQVPLLQGTGVGVALFSYDGKVCWGFNGDYAIMPDLENFRRDVAASFRELAEAAGAAPGADVRALRSKPATA